jgi:predicted ATPase/DNA-binding SARP family transcriptional activator
VTIASPEDVRVELLGALRVTAGEHEIVIHAPKERVVLVFMALSPGRTLRTRELIEGLWGENPPASARKALQTYVSALRRRLPPGAIETTPDGYRLDIPADAVDVTVFERLVDESRLARAGGAYQRAVTNLLEARRLWRGEPLTELGDHLAGAALLARLVEIRNTSEEDLAEARLALGDHLALVPELEAAVAAQPLRERRWGQLMLALYRSGRQADALRAFQRLRKELGEELGIEPSAELVTLEGAIVMQRPELAPPSDTFGQPGSDLADTAIVSRVTGVPRSTTALIGREGELTIALRLLKDHRLVTLVGAGGSGKTKLAAAIAAAPGELPVDEVCWVGLQSVWATDLVIPAIAQGLGARGDIADHIGDRGVLLILDNFEQVVDIAPDILDLLSRSVNLRILVTSREPLRVEGEYLLPVGPLSEAHAEQLFIERASAEDPSFTPGPSLHAICQRLDRLPLAIELAAARVSLFTLDELLVRLHRALPILTGQRRDVPERQRTLEATIRWSYDLLQPRHQRILRWLSPFDTFEPRAAERVSACDMDSLHVLLGKNLIRHAGGDRFELLQTVRQFALDRLQEHQESEAAYQALAGDAIDILSGAAVGLHGPEQAQSLARLDSEYGNLRAAAQWAMTDEPATSARLAVGLGWYWLLRNHTGEGVSFLQRFRTTADSLAPPLRAALLGTYGRLLFYRGEARHAISDTEDAREVLLEAEDAWERSGQDSSQRADCIERVATLVYLSIVAGSSGRRTLARETGLKAIAVGEATGDPWCTGLAYWALGTNVFLRRCDADNPDEVRKLLEYSIAQLRQAGDSWALGGPLLYLGRHLLAAGDTEAAFVTGTEALHAFRRVGEKWRTALALRHLANVAQTQGKSSAADSLRDEAEYLERELGDLATSVEG